MDLRKTDKLVPLVLGLNAKEAMERLQFAGAIVSFKSYSSRKGVYDSDDVRIIRQKVLQESPLEVELLGAPCRIAIRQKENGAEGK